MNPPHLSASKDHRFEKIKTLDFTTAAEASKIVAQEIAKLIIQKQQENKMCVLGLATGSSPVDVYRWLVHLHKNEGLSFQNVVTFNLDEYYPMNPKAIQSYVRFMHEQLFDHIDIDSENIYIPDGTIAKADIKQYTEAYEEKIASHGGIDLQLLGIGRTGHIGFNEPGSSLNSTTRLVVLDRITKLDAASDFLGEEYVPTRAITMGVGTILKAKQIILLAWGEGKAKVVKQAVEGDISETIPATYLQQHPNCQFVLDSASASQLTRNATPWLVKECHWDTPLIKKASIWLSSVTSKPILKLTNEDYNEYSLGELVAEIGTAENINLMVFNELQKTITGWPGGKPHADDTNRPERAKPAQKRVLIFSPHPDDDVISMGGTLIRLVDQGHKVHVAYQTSGNIAVFDDEVVRFLDFARDIADLHESCNKLHNFTSELKTNLIDKKEGVTTSADVLQLKSLIRKGEALAACRYCGIDEKNAHFMNLPFYETGTIKKNPPSQEDVEIVAALLNAIKPHQIYAAGDLSDPHGTHRVCLQLIFDALELLKPTHSWLEDTYVWLYRGAWQEWDIADIEMAVPIGPKDMSRKRNAIFKHQSQKDKAMFPGADEREFWQRAEQRNRETAHRYNNLGLAEYEAIEGFVRYRF